MLPQNNCINEEVCISLILTEINRNIALTLLTEGVTVIATLSVALDKSVVIVLVS